MALFPSEKVRPSQRAWVWLALWAVIALLAYIVIVEHRVHALEFLPYALLLVCPLMHVFMHGRHGHHHGHGNARSARDEHAVRDNGKHESSR